MEDIPQQRWNKFLLSKPEYSANKLKKLGKALVQGDTTEYSDLMKMFLLQHARLTDEYGKFLLKVLSDAPDFLYHDQFSPFSNLGLELSSRVKSGDTMREKLIRGGHHDLSRIRDVSGLRIQGDISRRNQYLLAEKIIGMLENVGLDCKLIDRIQEPVEGYRALHIEVNAPAGRSEIQLRSRLQSLWANVSEKAADLFGREIRYSTPTDETAKHFSDKLKILSEKNSTLEETWNLNFSQHDQLRQCLQELSERGMSLREILPDGLEPLESAWYQLLDSKRELEQSLNRLKTTIEGGNYERVLN